MTTERDLRIFKASLAESLRNLVEIGELGGLKGVCQSLKLVGTGKEQGTN